jgi:hydroxymethylpyrimidine pyrophosphatase-like HAD family hydrolase
MYVLRSDKVLYVDCDNTLVYWNGDEWHGDQKYITLIKQFHARGQGIVVWSAGGYNWAQTVVTTLGLESYVDVILCKCSWFADDQPASEFMLESSRIFFK